MAQIISNKTARVTLDGHDVSSLLTVLDLRVSGFNIIADIHYVDGDSSAFDPVPACVNRSDVELGVAFGAGCATIFRGKVESARRDKRVGEPHLCELVFEGEPV